MKENGLASEVLAQKLRIAAVRMVAKANTSHIGSCLSAADLLACLYQEVLNVNPLQPDWEDRDRLILSKGHAAAVLYAVLAEKGFFPKEWLDTYCLDGSRLGGHVSHQVPGVEFSTGSLGHGLPVGCGLALAGKRENRPYRVFVLLSDGELDEGSNWEAILFAPQHQLDHLSMLIDYNKIQSFGFTHEVLDINPLAEKLRAFRWAVKEIDGHDHTQILAALQSLPFEPGKPNAVIAHTIKGKGVSFMENQLAWHYKSPNPEQLAQALHELGAIS